MKLLSLIRKYYTITYIENTYGVWQAISKFDPEDKAQGVLENVLDTLVARIAEGIYPYYKINIFVRNSLRVLLYKRNKRRYRIIKTDKGVFYEQKYKLHNECINDNYQHFYQKRVYKNK